MFENAPIRYYEPWRHGEKETVKISRAPNIKSYTHGSMSHKYVEAASIMFVNYFW
jgi:hypothetical protein